MYLSFVTPSSLFLLLQLPGLAWTYPQAPGFLPPQGPPRPPPDVCYRRNDTLEACPYGGTCFPNQRYTCQTSCINYHDTDSRFWCTIMCGYNATTLAGIVAENPLLCIQPSARNGITCPSGYACFRRFSTKAPLYIAQAPVCSMQYNLCYIDGKKPPPPPPLSATNATNATDTNVTESVPEKVVPEQTTPEQTAPEQRLPDQTMPGQTVPAELVPQESVPKQSAPEQSGPGNSVPVEPAPEQSVSEQPVPVGSVPLDSVPKDSVQQEPVPKEMVQNEPMQKGSAQGRWLLQEIGDCEVDSVCVEDPRPGMMRPAIATYSGALGICVPKGQRCEGKAWNECGETGHCVRDPTCKDGILGNGCGGYCVKILGPSWGTVTGPELRRRSHLLEKRC